MRIAVLGSGGREHALQWCLSLDPGVDAVLALPGNGGTSDNLPVDPMDLAGIGRACDREAIDLLVVGPEGPLAAGIADAFSDHRTRVIGPTRFAARLESSKVWAKAFMVRHGIPTADHALVASRRELAAFAAEHHGEAVLKADGLAAGKGVAVCCGPDELDREWARIGALRPNGERFLAEERLDGWELSVHILTDGRTWCPLPMSQDHKPLLDGDRGPNTGGMGAFSPVAACDEVLMRRIADEIVEPTLGGLAADSIDYRGFLYFGLMITEAGPHVLEYNVRLGDPEAQVLLPAITPGLSAALIACLDGDLTPDALRFGEHSFVGVVLVSAGYPISPETGRRIDGIEAAAETALVFHAGTVRRGKRVYSSGGRVLNVVGDAGEFEDAIDRAYTACNCIHLEGMQFRTDIGRRGIG